MNEIIFDIWYYIKNKKTMEKILKYKFIDFHNKNLKFTIFVLRNSFVYIIKK